MLILFLMTQGAFDRLDPSGRFSKEMVKSTPVGRFGELEEIANLTAYMVSDYSTFMNGSVSHSLHVTHEIEEGTGNTSHVP